MRNTVIRVKRSDGTTADLNTSELDIMRQREHGIIRISSSNTVEKMYKESTSSAMPKVGSRVRRGPDWKWNDQDGEGPGTIIGHAGE